MGYGPEARRRSLTDFGKIRIGFRHIHVERGSLKSPDKLVHSEVVVSCGRDTPNAGEQD